MIKVHFFPYLILLESYLMFCLVAEKKRELFCGCISIAKSRILLLMMFSAMIDICIILDLFDCIIVFYIFC